MNNDLSSVMTELSIAAKNIDIGGKITSDQLRNWAQRLEIVVKDNNRIQEQLYRMSDPVVDIRNSMEPDPVIKICPVDGSVDFDFIDGKNCCHYCGTEMKQMKGL